MRSQMLRMIGVLGLWLACGAVAATAGEAPETGPIRESPGSRSWTPEPPPPGPNLALIPEARDGAYWRRNIFRRVWEDQQFMIRSWWPSELQRPQVVVPLLATAVVASRSHGSAEAWDRRIVADLSGAGNPFDPTTETTLTRLGNSPVVAVMLGAGYLAGRTGRNDRLARACSLSFEAMLDGGIWTVLLKRSFSRTRPSWGGTGEFFRYSPRGRHVGGSFPSGHAMTAFAVATVFAGEYRDRRWVRWIGFSAAGLVSLSRVARRQHFVSDVIVGAMLGNSVGRMVLIREHGLPEDRRSPWRDGRLVPAADAAGRIRGVAYSVRW